MKTSVCCAETDPVRAVTVNQNIRVAAGQLNEELRLTVKQRGVADSCDNSVSSSLSHCHIVI